MSDQGHPKPDQSTSNDPNHGSASTASTSTVRGSDKAYEETRDAFILGFNVIREVSEATELLSPLKSTCLLLLRGLETTRSMNNNRKALQSLASQLKSQLTTLEDYQTRLKNHPANLDLTPIEPLEQYAQSLKDVLAGAITAEKKMSKGKNFVKRIIRTNLDTDDIQDQIQSVDAAYKRFMEAMKILQWVQTADQTVMIKSQTALLEDQSLTLKTYGQMMQEHSTAMRQVQEALKKVNRDAGSTVKEEEALLELAYGVRLDLCQEGTRVEVLDMIRSWIEDTATLKQIFWLSDIAGTGKSTIAATIADGCIDTGQLAGRFFFSPNSESTSNLSIFCETVANDMLGHLTSIKSAIETAIVECESKKYPLHRKFKRLLIDPLEQIDETVIFIFDALDNCDITGHRTLLQLLIKHLPSVPTVKVFLTSRPLASIKDLLDTSLLVTGHDIQLYSVQESGSNPDIAIYINQQYNFHYLSQVQRNELVIRSKGLFIWAATASRLFENNRSYDDLLSMLFSPEYAGDMDQLYLGILRRALVDPKAHNEFMNVLQVITTVIEPVSISTIEVYFPRNRLVNAFVQDLCSVVKDGDPHRPIHVIHPTFREFLTHSLRANGFLVEPFPSHALLAMACLTCLFEQLEYDIAGQHQPGMQLPSFNYKTRNAVETRLQRRSFDAIYYASKYWASHVIHSAEDPNVVKMLRRFLNENILNWMEFLSLCKVIPHGVQSLLNFSAFVQASVKLAHSKLTYDDAMKSTDALRFMQRHQAILSSAALHVYRSALLFTPHKTSVYRDNSAMYEHLIPEILSGLAQTWEPYVPLRGHGRGVSCVSFSPDGNLVAAGGVAGVRIWERSTGSLIDGGGQPSGDIYGLLFTPDGQTVVVWGNDNDIILFDAPTGAMKEDRLVGHEDVITAVAVSSDGIHIASGSKDDTLRVWELTSGECQSVLKSDHHGDIKHLIYSPNCSVLVSASDEDIIIWDFTNRTLITSLRRICEGEITVLRFLLDGKTLLCGGKDKVLHLIHVDPPYSVSNVNGCDEGVICCALMSDGSQIAAGGEGGTVLVWETGSMPLVCRPFRGHSKGVISILFAPDGSKLITASRDNTVRLWDMATAEHTIGILDASNNNPWCFAFSPDATQFITGYGDGTLLLWSVNEDFMGAPERSKAHITGVYYLSVSSDHTTIASASEDGTIRFWDVGTGQYKSTSLVAHNASVRCLTFSLNGEYLASGSDDTTARIWIVPTGVPQTAPLQHHSKAITSIAFSEEGKYLATGSTDHAICLWNVESGDMVGRPMIGHTHEIKHLAFLPGIGRLVSVSRDREIKQWSYLSGEEHVDLCLKHDNVIDDIAISSSGRYLAIVVNSKVEVWAVDPEWKKIGSALCLSSLTASSLFFDAREDHVWVADQVWHIRTDRLRLLNRHSAPPHPLSRLQYDRDRWVSEVTGAEGSKARLFRLPPDITVSRWIAVGDKIWLACHSGNVLVVDCERLFRFAES